MPEQPPSNESTEEIRRKQIYGYNLIFACAFRGVSANAIEKEIESSRYIYKLSRYGIGTIEDRLNSRIARLLEIDPNVLLKEEPVTIEDLEEAAKDKSPRLPQVRGGKTYVNQGLIEELNELGYQGIDELFWLKHFPEYDLPEENEDGTADETN